MYFTLRILKFFLLRTFRPSQRISISWAEVLEMRLQSKLYLILIKTKQGYSQTYQIFQLFSYNLEI